jgi:hypothetical protein
LSNLYIVIDITGTSSLPSASSRAEEIKHAIPLYNNENKNENNNFKMKILELSTIFSKKCR